MIVCDPDGAAPWFAVSELGVPATIAGTIVGFGFISGCGASVVAKASDRTRRADHG